MTVAQALQTELQRHGPFQGPAQTLSFTHEGRQVELALVELNSLACALESLVVRDPTLASAGIDRLRAVGEKLSAKVNYLLEPIQPIEVDSEQCSVQMRSSPPSLEENRASYYELLVKKPGIITLTRFAKQPGDARQLIPAEVTRAVLARLVTDFCEAGQQ